MYNVIFVSLLHSSCLEWLIALTVDEFYFVFLQYCMCIQIISCYLLSKCNSQFLHTVCSADDAVKKIFSLEYSTQVCSALK